MYPRLVMNMTKLRANIDAVAKITKEGGKCDTDDRYQEPLCGSGGEPHDRRASHG